MNVWQWFLHVIGAEPRTPSVTYNFWSGFGSDMTEFIVFAGAAKIVNCHEKGCWRLGLRTTVEPSGAHVRLCRKHHNVKHDITE